MIGNGRAWMAANCEPRRYGAALAAILREACAATTPRDAGIAGTTKTPRDAGVAGTPSGRSM